ncbi:pentapeptide repeat-containing protein [Halocatena marina]|uniref:pentapeptide repeat-containing protein n=1 Tax=Halocatena marina TaxID=2934937 RepID=UPI00200C72F5|nr:pentapeptide repeat-containing protein [Halocatena marina]
MAEKKAEIPADRCGFELCREDVEWVFSQSRWNELMAPVCCWRPVWNSHDDTERCIWHADIDEKPLAELIAARADASERLDGAILRNLQIEHEALSFADCTLNGATFDNSVLRKVDFISATLRLANFTTAHLRWTDFTDATLIGADFTNATPIGGNFTNTDLRWSDFRDADLATANFADADCLATNLSNTNVREANFRHATLQHAVLTRADCRGTTFTSALLYETVFSDTRINSQTTFFDPEATFYDSITSRPGCVYEENPLSDEQLPEGVHPLEAARWVYRRLETLHEENALSEAAREFHISKEEAERALNWKQGEYRRWGVKTLMWHLTRHGESVQRLLIWWGLVIAAGGVLFSAVGGVMGADGTHYAITSLAELGTLAGWKEVGWNLYFSLATFTTIMDGGLAPVGPWTRAIVAGESLAGIVLTALFVFILGRRTAR